METTASFEAPLAPLTYSTSRVRRFRQETPAELVGPQMAVARRPDGRGRRARPVCSHPGARAWVRGHVSSRGFALRDAREGDVQDVVPCAGVDDLIHFAGSFDERLPGAVRRGLALAANRSVNSERALFDDDDRASRMGMPPRVATWFDRDLHHGYIRSALKRDGPIRDVRPTRQRDVRQS